MLKLQSKILVNMEDLFISNIPSPLSSGVVLIVKAPAMGQIKLFNYLQRIFIISFNHIPVFKLFVLDKNTW